MDIFLILSAGFVGTSIMTFFSYVIAWIKSSQFREPELLNMLISRTETIPFKLNKKSLLGWVLHYIIGWIFVIGFDVFWRFTAFNPSLVSGAVLGFAAGIVGMIGWKIMFSITPDEPRIAFKKFYLQLFLAHIIFGMAVALVYLLW